VEEIVLNNIDRKPPKLKIKPIPNRNANLIPYSNPNPTSLILITCRLLCQLQMCYYAISPDVIGDPLNFTLATNPNLP